MANPFSNMFDAFSGKSNAPGVNLNQRFSTGNSTLQSGNLNLDPSIRNIQNQSLTGFGSLLSESQNNRADFSRFGTGFSNLGTEFAGNQGSLINARLNPLRSNIARRRGDLDRGLSRRGVFGTFANQDRDRFEFESGRELGDAEALATQDALSARTNLLGAEFGVAQQQAMSDIQAQGFEASLNQLIQSVGAERFAQEMAGLGLSSDVVNALLLSAQRSAGLTDAARQEGAKQFHQFNKDIMSSIGQGMSMGG